MKVRHSESESNRFGHRVGRLNIVDAADVVDIEEQFAAHDIVILRAPASLRVLPAALAQLSDHRSIPADNLCYWEWPVERFHAVSVPRDVIVSIDVGRSELLELVRATFHGYGNHYAANPLLEGPDVLDGYCEWVDSMLSSAESSCFVMRERSGDLAGFALIDWDVDTPDIRLAGMSPHAQGRGLYGPLLSAVMSAAIERNRAPIQISTQSDNINVMRTWARLGLLPHSTFVTIHVIKRALLNG